MSLSDALPMLLWEETQGPLLVMQISASCHISEATVTPAPFIPQYLCHMAHWSCLSPENVNSRRAGSILVCPACQLSPTLTTVPSPEQVADQSWFNDDRDCHAIFPPFLKNIQWSSTWCDAAWWHEAWTGALALIRKAGITLALPTSRASRIW